MRSCFITVLLVCSLSCFAQRDEQLWLDFQLDYPFGGQYLFEATAAYQTLLSSEGKWRSFNLSPSFEYQGLRIFDVSVELPFAYTLQAEDVNSYEVSPALTGRLHITQNKRVNARIFMKLEERFFRQVQAEDWDHSNRFRLKGELWIAINKRNLFQDNLWYTFLEYEEFFVTDQQLDERFANRRRGRIGLGYRLNYKNRFELLYARQSSRNEIEGDFVSADNIIGLKYKFYLNPSRVTQ